MYNAYYSITVSAGQPFPKKSKSNLIFSRHRFLSTTTRNNTHLTRL